MLDANGGDFPSDPEQRRAHKTEARGSHRSRGRKLDVRQFPIRDACADLPRNRFDQRDGLVIQIAGHGGRGFYNEFFRKCHELLADDGVFVLHSCGRSDGPGITNPWLAKYIFPGGYIPALSEVLPAIERTGFLVTDIEILRLHYADTLKECESAFWLSGAKYRVFTTSGFVACGNCILFHPRWHFARRA
jgi:mycolic acid cyclopropane synthetase